MYSLDINLLSERPEYQSGKQTQFTSKSSIASPKFSKVPLFIGAGVTVLSLLAIGGGWMWTGQQTTQLEAKQQELDKKLGSLQAQDRQLQQINGEVTQVTDRNQALAGVFNQIQPWSAVLQDLRESIPQGVQIANVAQSEVKFSGATPPPPPPPPPGGAKLLDKISGSANPEIPKPSPTPGASPATAAVPSDPASAATPASAPTATLPNDVPTTKLDITGTAKSFDEVNNFMLTLKQSAFFNPDDTQLLSASLGGSVPLTKMTPVAGQIPTEQELAAAERMSHLELPKVVEYKIQTSLKRVPAADAIRELERKGAVGLVTRLRSLQQQQVIK
jgi:type IV pilus assembly protein PilN